MHDSSMDRCREFIAKYLDRNKFLTIADVGSYDVNGTYRALFDCPNWIYVGVDIENGPNVDVVVVPDTEWPMKEHFDVVISGQCMEHVAAPWRWIKNVASLGRSGATFWVTAPNTWEFHQYPIDAWRVWPDGLRELFREGGLEPLEAEFIGRDTWGTAIKP